MDWADYLRDEAAKYRQLAETAEDLSIKQELLDLAAVCEGAAAYPTLSDWLDVVTLKNNVGCFFSAVLARKRIPLENPKAKFL